MRSHSGGGSTPGRPVFGYTYSTVRPGPSAERSTVDPSVAARPTAGSRLPGRWAAAPSSRGTATSTPTTPLCGSTRHGGMAANRGERLPGAATVARRPGDVARRTREDRYRVAEHGAGHARRPPAGVGPPGRGGRVRRVGDHRPAGVPEL